MDGEHAARGSILIVDDEPACWNECSNCQDSAFQATEAIGKRWTPGPGIIHREPVALVLLDLMMRSGWFWGTGGDAKTETTRNILVVVITGSR